MPPPLGTPHYLCLSQGPTHQHHLAGTSCVDLARGAKCVFLCLASQSFGILQGRPHLTLSVAVLKGAPVCSLEDSVDSCGGTGNHKAGSRGQTTLTEGRKRQGPTWGFYWVETEQPALKKCCFCSSLKDMLVSEEDHVVTCIPAKATAPTKILGQRQSKD